MTYSIDISTSTSASKIGATASTNSRLSIYTIVPMITAGISEISYICCKLNSMSYLRNFASLTMKSAQCRQTYQASISN